MPMLKALTFFITLFIIINIRYRSVKFFLVIRGPETEVKLSRNEGDGQREPD